MQLYHPRIDVADAVCKESRASFKTNCRRVDAFEKGYANFIGVAEQLQVSSYGDDMKGVRISVVFSLFLAIQGNAAHAVGPMHGMQPQSQHILAHRCRTSPAFIRPARVLESLMSNNS